ncbi:elongation factor P 5-aminopentanone reductase [Butyrivibrio sp. YAB3001]|uniref:elongation factor P 5-aminopentanone reductase n=1 Tax=Butyrivibrio sp. YAB3001 TaxID=1520812 RepID=UPI0008F64460|nr:SDR family NAD(P)-dependent oxidoreductase [Butyrivibrio sp. YAB3001]SFB87584.1 3-oxoacyl-[acyl-carrier protein] reductase [Butyrivibrio sp. YAB3001]
MNRNVLITGASRGIGKSIAEAFAMQKDNLYLTCVNNVDMLKEYALELQETYGVQVQAFKCDSGNFDEVKDMFTRIKDIDVVVNNAGVAWIGLLTDMEVSDWKKVMNTNLDSLFCISKFAVPIMVKKHSGRIINISSVWGNVGASCEVAYSASKGGVNSFTRALAKELAPSGISVNAIACGVIDTDMNRLHLSEEDMQELTQEIPMDRLGSPKEVAELVIRITDAPSYMTGQIITIDGGWI